MKKYIFQGESIRAQAKALVIDYMEHVPDCRSNSEGQKQSEIIKACGLDWGNKEKATASNQQYWGVALLRELEEQGLVEQITESGPWRLT
jgi:hypothetical protein